MSEKKIQRGEPKPPIDTFGIWNPNTGELEYGTGERKEIESTALRLLSHQGESAPDFRIVQIKEVVNAGKLS